MSEPAQALSLRAPSRPGSDLDRLKRLVLTGITSSHSRRAYGQALDDFLRWYQADPRGFLSKRLVEEYRTRLEDQALAPSTINIRLTVVRRFAATAGEAGFLSPETAAGIVKVRGIRKAGLRTGNCLNREHALQLLHAPDPGTLKGKRDRVVLSMLIGCGLRRSEIAALGIEMIQQREGRWMVVDVVGKGNRTRMVPIPAWVKQLIDDWLTAAKIDAGNVLRPIDKKGRLAGESVTPKVVSWIVLGYARGLGLAPLSPQDLRRTCAKLCRASGGEIEQIQFLLGHASIQTTEQYLGPRQSLVEAVNDRMGLEL